MDNFVKLILIYRLAEIKSIFENNLLRILFSGLFQ